MARPRAELPDPDSLRGRADDQGRLAVRVLPGARMEAIEIGAGQVLVKVRAKPEDGKATAAAIALVASTLGMAPSLVTLLRGATSREKLLQLPTDRN